MTFIQAMQTKDTLTENGMPTHSSSGAKVVDLFFRMGGSRNLSDADLRALFAEAFGENPELALKAAFYNRDVRGGQGERRSFRTFFRYLCELAPKVAIANLPNVPFYGRWDDLFVAVGTPVEKEALSLIMAALLQGDKLAAKWMPREGKKDHALANVLRRHAGLSWVEYRKLLAGNTDVVENKMCAGRWADINYNHVPSLAVKKYRKAFLRQDEGRYSQWVTDLSDPNSGAKINASAIFPHDVLKPIVDAALNHYTPTTMAETEKRALEAQWAALPDYMPKGKRVLPVVDVSGSMYGLPMEVAVSLGLYIAERNEGPFHNGFITFSASPQFHVLKARDLESRVHEVMNADWGMNTNLEAVFRLILNRAMAAKLPAEDMPEAILILSDMQFDQCVRNADDTALEMIERMYQQAGYKRPQIIFWNLRTSHGSPAKFDEHGTALVSGFSPSILGSVFQAVGMTPEAVVSETLGSERYARVTLTGVPEEAAAA